MKPMMNDKGEIEMDLISTSQALQIAGRAGRYNTAYEHGEVTTFYSKDLRILKDIVKQPIEPVMVSRSLAWHYEKGCSSSSCKPMFPRLSSGIIGSVESKMCTIHLDFAYNVKCNISLRKFQKVICY